MKKTHLCFLLGLFVSSAPPCYAERPFFWTIEAGTSTLKIEEQYYINDYDTAPEALAISSHFGYQFDNHWLAGVGFAYATSSVSAGIIDDNYAFGELRAFTGYSFKLGERFYLVPVVGVSGWSLITNEALIFRDDDAEPEDEMDGTDIYGQLNAEIPMGTRLSLTLSYTRVTTAPAQISSTKLGLLGRF